MKKYLILFLLAYHPFLLFSQTEEEAQDFIKTYIEAYPQNNGESGEENAVYFEDSLMVYGNHLPFLGLLTSVAFDVGDVRSITIDNASMKGKNIQLKIRFQEGAKVMQKLMYGNSDAEVEYPDMATITLGNLCVSEDFPGRIKKAMLHLAKLKGAVINDKF